MCFIVEDLVRCHICCLPTLLSIITIISLLSLIKIYRWVGLLDNKIRNCKEYFKQSLMRDFGDLEIDAMSQKVKFSTCWDLRVDRWIISGAGESISQVFGLPLRWMSAEKCELRVRQAESVIQKMLKQNCWVYYWPYSRSATKWTRLWPTDTVSGPWCIGEFAQRSALSFNRNDTNTEPRNTLALLCSHRERQFGRRFAFARGSEKHFTGQEEKHGYSL